jgi:hypothetical protein
MNPVQTQRQDREAVIRELEAAGATVRGNAIRCPFHDDQHPSGGVYRDGEGIWRFKCHGCGWHGDVFDVKVEATGRPLDEVLREANGEAGRWRDSGKAPKVYPTIEDLRLAISQTGDIETEFTYAGADTGQTDLLVFRLRTPDGKTFRQAHLVKGGFVQKAPAQPWPLYNRARVRAADTVVVVEGEKCVHALHDVGVVATTSPGGAGKGEHADWSPLAGKIVTLWPDNDIPGRNHMADVAGILERLDPAPRVLIIKPVDLDLGEKEDAFDFIEQCNATGADPRQEVLRALSKAKPRSASRGLRQRLERVIDGRWYVVALPWPKVSKLTQALTPKTVTVLCGTPGATKSFALGQCMAFWFGEGFKVACYHLEEDREYHLRRALAQREGNSDLLDEEWVKDNPILARDAYERHRDFLDAFSATIWDAPDRQPTLDVLAGWVEARAKDGCRVIAIDPITAAEIKDKVYIDDSRFIAACKATVRKYETSLLLVTHPRKGSGKAVGLDDLAGGASYQRLAQTILWLEFHKPPKTETVKTDAGRIQMEINRTLHICKARNGQGTGLSLGCQFDNVTLALAEQGIIVRETK